MKRFHLSGSAEYTWLAQIDAETKEEAESRAYSLVESGQVTEERFNFISVGSCDEEVGVHEEES